MAFEYPWLLLLIPALTALVVLLYARTPGRGCKARALLGVRIALVCLLTLVLCGTQLRVRAPESAAWVLLDASASTLGQRAQMEKDVSAALSALPARTQAGVIAFGQDAMVELPLSQAPGFSAARARVDADGSDLNRALSLASALLPSDAPGRIAVISDGRMEGVDGSALRARGVAVDVLIAQGAEPPDAQVSGVSLPSIAYQGQSFLITVRLHSNMDAVGTLVLYAGGAVAGTRAVTLRPGENTYTFEQHALEPGVLPVEAQLIVQGDQVGANNRAGGYIVCRGQPSVLLVEGKAGSAREMEKLLSASGYLCERIVAARLPESGAALLRYDGVVLVNVSADALTAAACLALDGAVRASGRGLAVFGGDDSYALGGYRASALEEMLPVTMDVRNKLAMPTLALALVIDKSGSMTDGYYGVTRLELAKEAAMRAAEVLTTRDQVGVIAFDGAAKWVVPLEQVVDVPSIQQRIGTIRPGGGTAFYSPLVSAWQALAGAEAQRKHVIFLTDGEPGDSGYEAVADAMAQSGITLTTVAVGSGANAVALRALAERGGGRFYAAGEFDSLPKIFTKETYLVHGSYVRTHAFTPVVTERSALTEFARFPVLDGYLSTTEKTSATVSLMSDLDEPVLAWWRLGAGKVLCWTSDVQGAWTQDYLNWDQAVEFFSGMISFVLPAGAQQGEMALEGGVLRYEAPDADSAPVRAQVLAPDGTRADVTLDEVAPGVYEAAVDQSAPGAYTVRIEQDAPGGVRVLEGGGVTGYAPEYDLRLSGRTDALEKLARETGGRVVTDARELLTKSGPAVRARRDITTALLIGALVLMVVGVALDRLPWDHALESAVASARSKKRKAPPAPRTRGEKGAERADGAQSAGQDGAQTLVEGMRSRRNREP